MRQVFSVETEREKDLQAVADTMASCQLKLDYKMCHPFECETCETYRELEACRRELCACDSLKVKQQAVASYRIMRFSFGLGERGGKVKNALKEAGSAALTGVGMLLACLAVLAFFVWAATLPIRAGW